MLHKLRTLLRYPLVIDLSDLYLFFVDSVLIVYAFWFVQQAEQDYEKEKLNERIAKLSGGVAVIQVHTNPIGILKYNKKNMLERY